MQRAGIEEILEKERKNPSFALSLDVIDAALKEKLLTHEDEKLFTTYPRNKGNFFGILNRMSIKGILALAYQINPNSKIVVDGKTVMCRMGNYSFQASQESFSTHCSYTLMFELGVAVDTIDDLRYHLKNRVEMKENESRVVEMIGQCGVTEETSKRSFDWCKANLGTYVNKIDNSEGLLLSIIDRKRKLGVTKTLQY